MILKVFLIVLALFLLTGCAGGRKGEARTAYDPCEQMKADGREVDTLQDQVRGLQSKAYPDTRDKELALIDTASQAKAESSLVRKENLLSLAVQSMERSAMDCAARSQPFDRFRTSEERERGGGL